MYKQRHNDCQYEKFAVAISFLSHEHDERLNTRRFFFYSLFNID